MSKEQKMEAKILDGYRNAFARPEVTAKRYKMGAIVLLLLAVLVAALSGYLVDEKAQYDAGQLLAILSGIMIGLSVMLFMNSSQVISFAKFCMLKSEYRGQPIQPPQRNAGSRPSSVDSPASETSSSLGPRG